MSVEELDEPVQILVKKEWCKGCSICVDMCPQNVLVMNKGLPEVVNIDACTVCMLCEMRCPDFAITVTGVRRKKETALNE